MLFSSEELFYSFCWRATLFIARADINRQIYWSYYIFRDIFRLFWYNKLLRKYPLKNSGPPMAASQKNDVCFERRYITPENENFRTTSNIPKIKMEKKYKEDLPLRCSLLYCIIFQDEMLSHLISFDFDLETSLIHISS